MTSQRASLAAALVTFGMVLFGGSAAPAATGPARLLKDINTTPSPTRGSFPQRYQRLGNIALFQALTPLAGVELWRTDGTEAGTVLVKDIWPGPAGALQSPSGPDNFLITAGNT
ncbi:MAG: hypothetical protein ACRDHF_11555, partial [Tepidiformaceae bacterium]